MKTLVSSLSYVTLVEKNWEEVETRLGQRLIRVYDLKGGAMRLNSTTAAVYHDPEGKTLFRHGKSKDHRPDLAQFYNGLVKGGDVGHPGPPGDAAGDPCGGGQ
jgi:transposase